MSIEPQPMEKTPRGKRPAADPIAKVRALARPVESLREELRDKVATGIGTAEAARLVDDAFLFAVEAHGTQVRASGEPYVTHPAEAALILADLGLDAATLVAALLHDVPEDTSVTTAEIAERFGDEVGILVDGVTKLSKFSAMSAEEQHAENIRKMFLAMAQDIRVVLIKLGDRLHNMRTLAALPPEKQRRIARQTLEIYAPLAERLGIWQMKWELEDLAFKALEPERYHELASMVDLRRDMRADYVQRAIAVLKPELERAGIAAEFSGRAKHLYSIHKKMARRSSNFSEIYDVYAIRVIVENLRDCYAALGAVHSVWRPIPNQFDDYIAVPKNNLYQSLHTA
ncbi:MAG: RelA/SpoT family protein, partial [Candidatus Limnocylindrus sp.]